MKARCKKELTFDGFTFEVDKEYEFEVKVVYLPAEMSECVLARGNRSRHLQYSTKIEATWTSCLHRTEKVPMTLYFYDRQYCINRDWHSEGVGIFHVNGGQLLCFEDWFIESEPAQHMKNMQAIGQLPSQEEFRRMIMNDPADWDKIDSMDLRYHLSCGQQKRKPLSDYEVKIDTSMFFDKESVQRAFKQPEWPRGTEVVAYCWEEDREAVSRQVEQWGYKLDGFVNLADYMHTFIERGRCVLVLKSALLWKPDPNKSVVAWWDI